MFFKDECLNPPRATEAWRREENCSEATQWVRGGVGGSRSLSPSQKTLDVDTAASWSEFWINMLRCPGDRSVFDSLAPATSTHMTPRALFTRHIHLPCLVGQSSTALDWAYVTSSKCSDAMKGLIYRKRLKAPKEERKSGIWLRKV